MSPWRKQRRKTRRIRRRRKKRRKVKTASHEGNKTGRSIVEGERFIFSTRNNVETNSPVILLLSGGPFCLVHDFSMATLAIYIAAISSDARMNRENWFHSRRQETREKSCFPLLSKPSHSLIRISLILRTVAFAFAFHKILQLLFY